MNKTKEEIEMWKEVAINFSELYNRGPSILRPIQRMFPNCQKYTKCCTEDKSFWDVVDKMNKAGELKIPEAVFDTGIKMISPPTKQKIPEEFKRW